MGMRKTLGVPGSCLPAPLKARAKKQNPGEFPHRGSKERRLGIDDPEHSMHGASGDSNCG